MNEEYQKIYDYALRLLSYRARSIEEVKRKLVVFAKKRKIEESFIGKIIADLTTQKLLDDTSFALWWIEQRNTFRPKGVRALQMELRQKGIEKEIIDTVLEKSPDSTKQELELAKSLIKRKFPDTHLGKEEVRKKIAGFLARRGFSWDIVSIVLDESSEKE